MAGTSPGSGAGCWNSVKNNAAFAGGTADFTGAESAGATKPLQFAFEANNALGSAGASTFTLNWKVPQVRLVTTQVLSGVALDATASDGHPSASGYKWYFGDSPSALTLDPSCTAATCVPSLQATGTPHYYWVTVPYSQIGYSTPDCPGAPNCTSSLGSYYVTNFAPAFTVNGAATGPVTAVAGQSLTVSNSSQRGTTVTGAGGYYYSLCASPCSADNYVLWGTMGDAPPSGSPAYPATIPNPGVGSWLLKIKVIYTNPSGTAYWPDPAGAAGFTVNVTSCSNPTFHINAGGGPAYPSPGFAVQAGQAVTFVPDNVYPAPYSWSFGDGGSDTTQSPTHTYSSAGNYTVTLTAANGACSVSYAMVVTSVNPLSVSASANPNPAGVGANVNFSCSASGGSGGYTYAWSGSAFSGTVAGQSVSQSFSSVGTYTAQCNVTDSTSHLAGAVVTLTVQSGGSGNCTTADFHIVVDGGALYGAFSVIAGHVVTFYPNDIYSSWSWNFGDGATDASQVPTHTYSTPGTYTVSLTANGNCTRSYQIVVTGTSTGGPSSSGCNTVDFSILDVSTGIASCGPFGCSGISGAALSFVPNPAMSVGFTSWNFGDGSTSTTASTTHTYAGGGTFTITLTAGTCTKTRAISISGPVALSGVFNAKYSDNSAFVATQVASGKEISFLAIDTADSYTWDFGDGTSPASGQTPKHTYVTPGSAPFTYTVTLNVTRGTGTSAQNASTTQPFTIIPPPEPPKWFVAGMAYLQGALPGTLWQTDVTLFNPDQSRPAVYSLAFLDGRTSVDPATLVWKTINLGAQQSISSSNILAFFGQPLGSFGALLVRGDSAPVPPVVTARTFNIGDPTKGTFGLSVPTTQPSSGLTPQAALSQQFLIGLRDDDAAYTNLGLMNLTTDWSHARLTFLDGSGATTLGQVNVDVPPYGVAQLTRPLFAAPPNGVGFQDPLANFSVKVSVLSGGSVFPYATVIDRRSTDAVVVTVSDRPTSVYRMPGIVRLQGANGTVWRSRFYVTNPSATSRKVSISYSFVPCDETGCKSRVTGLQSDVSLLPGETLWTDDFPKVWLAGFGFGVSDTTAYQNAYVDIFPAAGDPNQEPVLVLGETYNDQPSGPVGLQVPGFTDADAASKTGANKRLLLSGLVSNDSYRSNVALFLQSGTSGRCTVRVLTEAGLEVARQDVAFNSTDTFVQLNDAGLFGSLPGSKDRLTVVIDSFDGSPISAYATIVDNTSGDATFLKAQPAP
ncbi:MAG: PKD domain-containing protein [Acidobacteriota bacterium]